MGDFSIRRIPLYWVGHSPHNRRRAMQSVTGSPDLLLLFPESSSSISSLAVQFEVRPSLFQGHATYSCVWMIDEMAIPERAFISYILRNRKGSGYSFASPALALRLIWMGLYHFAKASGIFFSLSLLFLNSKSSHSPP